MRLVPTELPGVIVVEPDVFGDDRGWFSESYNEARFNASLQDIGLPATKRFVQDNHSCSKAGVLRGLHYQLPPHAQGKLVRVVKGAAYDVAVDIRQGSPTFGRWVGVELSEDNHRQLWVPEGFAHGFVVTSESADFLYKATDYYAPQHERCIAWDDPEIGIEWPALGPPSLSAKDAAGVRLADAETFE